MHRDREHVLNLIEAATDRLLEGRTAVVIAAIDAVHEDVAPAALGSVLERGHDVLIADGLVALEPNADHRRSQLVRMTELGERRYAAIDRLQNSHASSRISPFKEFRRTAAPPPPSVP